MTIHLARLALRDGDFRQALLDCSVYSFAEAPAALISAAAEICRHSLKHSKNACQSEIIFSHNLELEGAPMALLSIIEQGLFGKRSIVLSPMSGPLEGRIAESASNLVVNPKLLRSEIKSEEEFDTNLKCTAVFLSLLLPKSVFINTTRGFALAAACRFLGISYSWWIHEPEAPFSFLKSSHTQRLALLELEYCQNLLFASADTLTRYRVASGLKLGQARLLEPTIIRSALVEAKRSFDVDQKISTLRKDKSDFFLLSVGTICKRKNQAELVRSLHGINCTSPMRIRVFIVGDATAETAYTEDLRIAIDTLHATTELVRVSLIPPTEDIASYYLSADLFVHTSTDESYCQTVMEAAYFGIPLIVRECDGMHRILSQVKNASIYTNANQLHWELRSAIIRIG